MRRLYFPEGSLVSAFFTSFHPQSHPNRTFSYPPDEFQRSSNIAKNYKRGLMKSFMRIIMHHGQNCDPSMSQTAADKRKAHTFG